MRLFDLGDFVDESVGFRNAYAMHCPEEWMAEEFVQYLEKHDRKWISGESYHSSLKWEDSDECYLFNKGQHGGVTECVRQGIKILEYSDFDFKEYKTKEIDDTPEMDEFLRDLTK